ncbi:MAG: hypothetical protein OWS74_03205, partial [Firmicutes bacterium]|nr:hypothetical protein [Bacillota bacterium]
MWLAIPGLFWIILNIVHSAPPRFLLPGGFPSISYYSYSFVHLSYADVVALYRSLALYRHLIPYVQNPIQYPVVIGLYMSLMAWLPGFWG